MYEDPLALSPRLPLPDPLPSHRHDDDTIDDDVYRGNPPPPCLHPMRSYESLGGSSSSSSSSSSSFSLLGGGRLGAIATVVERAISRWARRRSSSSSISTSSSSSSESVLTLTRSQFSQRRRRRRRSSTGNLRSVRSVASDLVIERTITDLKAREELRQIPREFTLYLPPPLRRHRSRPHITPPPLTRTTSLTTVTMHLDFALKKTLRAKRRQERPRAPKVLSPSPPPRLHDTRKRTTTSMDHTPSTKGKERCDAHNDSPKPPDISSTAAAIPLPKAWWLDVANPSWDDIRVIGKLLHLHPLTLEDIFSQEPREKMESFSRLGYYFLVFRAIESQATQEKIQRAELHHGQSSGFIGEAIVYLVVFEEGICTFHFTDLSEHTNRVLNRILLLEETSVMSSDWIAHGMLDSIVDSFFPVLEKVENEVSEIETIVFSPQESALSASEHMATDAKSTSTLGPDEEKYSFAESKDVPDMVLQPPRMSTSRTQIRFTVRPDLTLVYRRIKRLVRSRMLKDHHDGQVTLEHQKPSPLQRMAKTRRVVTTLTRLLGSKSEVVSQLRKRLLNNAGLRGDKGEEEVAIYVGDVQDHILSLQHSLAHYERMLSQSHPAYLVQLRSDLARARSGNDKALMYLTVVSIGVICLQVLYGIFSMNCHVPGNLRAPGQPLTVFYEMIAFSIVVICAYASIVYRWFKRAKKRRMAAL